MDITFNREQLAIVKEARRFLEKECPMDDVRDMIEDGGELTEDLWAKMATMDWMSMHIPEQYDGMGMDLVDLKQWKKED